MCCGNTHQGCSQDFQRGRVDFLLKREKQGASEASIAYVDGFRGEAQEDIPFPWIWKPQIARKLTSWMFFFLSKFFKYNDDIYGDLCGDLYGDTFVATNFLISLFLLFSLYYFNFILLASQRASLAKGGGGVGRTHLSHWLRAWTFCVY